MTSSLYFKFAVILFFVLIFWTLRGFLLLIICSLVISNIVCNVSNQIQKIFRLPRFLSLFLVIATITFIIFAIFILVLPPFIKEFNEILVDIPNGLSKINILINTNLNKFNNLLYGKESENVIDVFNLINDVVPIPDGATIAKAIQESLMNLINLAELVDASRILNDYENNKKKLNKQSIFIEEIFEDLFNKKNISKNTIYNLTKSLDIGIVLTAHPTEVKRRTSIQKYHKIIEILEQRELLKNYPSKLKIIEKQLFDELTIIWNTDDLKRIKPSPFDEARWGLAIIEDSLWDTIPKVYRRLNSIFVKNMSKNLPKNFNPIVFGSWMGGDRDGNPNVTAEVTRKVILLSRWEAAKLYEKALTKIIRSYSMEKCSKKILNESLSILGIEAPETM